MSPTVGCPGNSSTHVISFIFVQHQKQEVKESGRTHARYYITIRGMFLLCYIVLYSSYLFGPLWKLASHASSHLFARLFVHTSPQAGHGGTIRYGRRQAKR